MKIAVVIPKYGLPGGAESYAYELSERLAAREGLEIHVFANKWRYGESSITFHKIPILTFPRFLTQVSFAHFANRKISLGDFDLIHSHDRIFSMDLFTMHSIPHKTWINEARGKTLSLFDRTMAWVERKGITGSPLPVILPVSNLVRDALLKAYDVPESIVRVIHPGVSTERFSGLDREGCRREIRQRYGLSLNEIVVLFVSMNFELKRLDLVMRGIAKLVSAGSTNSSLKLMIVGKGKKKKYQNLAQELRIADRVIFAGVIQDIEKYYLASDIFVMPSIFDTFGIAVLEAMMAGLPVIISQRVGAKDLIDPGVHGFVLSENPSPLDISQALASLLGSKERMGMGEKCRQVALAHDWNRMADQVAELYQQLAAEKKGSL
jgi:UDP-glucose:(heptosyl)LPS alpha-1,3-glucosyltransferase